MAIYVAKPLFLEYSEEIVGGLPMSSNKQFKIFKDVIAFSLWTPTPGFALGLEPNESLWLPSVKLGWSPP